MIKTPETFLAGYAQAVNTHQFSQVAPMIAENAVFWFNDGSHTGREAIQLAFEQTWKAIQEETYRIDDVEWLFQETRSAACIYTFHWRGMVNGTAWEGSGRGTTVLRKGAEGWQIVHEHLSRHPNG